MENVKLQYFQAFLDFIIKYLRPLIWLIRPNDEGENQNLFLGEWAYSTKWTTTGKPRIIIKTLCSFLAWQEFNTMWQEKIFCDKGSLSQRVGVFLPVSGKGLFIKFKQVNDNF